MQTTLHINVGGDPILAVEATQAIRAAGIEVRAQTRRTRGVPPLTDIIVALGSASAFTALCKVLCKLLEKHKDKEITIERNKTKIHLRGYCLPEVQELLQELTPELIDREKSRRTR